MERSVNCLVHLPNRQAPRSPRVQAVTRPAVDRRTSAAAATSWRIGVPLSLRIGQAVKAHDREVARMSRLVRADPVQS
jgi:hypothetical protein